MSAYLDEKGHFSRTFCIVCSWMEAVWEGTVWIVEADDETGRLALYGLPDDCQEFQQRCVEIMANSVDPGEIWRSM